MLVVSVDMVDYSFRNGSILCTFLHGKYNMLQVRNALEKKLPIQQNYLATCIACQDIFCSLDAHSHQTQIFFLNFLIIILARDVKFKLIFFV